MIAQQRSSQFNAVMTLYHTKSMDGLLQLVL